MCILLSYNPKPNIKYFLYFSIKDTFDNFEFLSASSLGCLEELIVDEWLQLPVNTRLPMSNPQLLKTFKVYKRLWISAHASVTVSYNCISTHNRQ